MRRPSRRKLQAIAIASASLPALVLGLRAASSGLGANPIEELTHTSGDWALRLLILTLAVSPARRLLGWAWLAPLRRTLGLAAFAYACLHFLTYLVLDQFFDWRAIWEDVAERRYISVGFTAFLCLIPLALTSTRAWMRRLGRRWIRLHRLVYVAAVGGVIHFLWLAKADLLAPLLHAAALALLLGLRVSRARPSAPARGGS